jgi:hypothetical protein
MSAHGRRFSAAQPKCPAAAKVRWTSFSPVTAIRAS